jgi:hypothetical protein
MSSPLPAGWFTPGQVADASTNQSARSGAGLDCRGRGTLPWRPGKAAEREEITMNAMRYKIALLALLALPAMFLVAAAGSAAAAPHRSAAGTRPDVTSSSLGTFKPTFTGPAATGCASGCHLLSGPFPTPSTAHLSPSQTLSRTAKSPDTAASLPLLRPRLPEQRRNAAAITIPTVSCVPLRAGCDDISSFAGGAFGVKGLNAVESAEHTNISPTFRDVEPPDQGLCAGNGYAVEDNNIGEVQIFNKNLKKVSPVISLDTIMGLTKRGWSSGGDISCLYDASNGGHWFYTEIVSSTPGPKGGPFAGCFAAKANTCYEGVAVTKGSSPFGPYNVYFVNANYNPKEPGYPYLLNDFGKIAATRDAFLLFYDEFPLNGSVPGLGGGFFNGSQEFAFDKTALEQGRPAGAVTVARENMGLLPTPDGTCFSDSKYFEPGVACWIEAIPAVAPDPSQWDNSHGGSGFMLATIDFYGLGGNQLAVFDWTGLKNLNSAGCSSCSAIRFGGQLFSGVLRYYDNPGLPSGILAPQKAGPIPLGDECGKAKFDGAPLSTVAHCPENGIATNDDGVTQASQGDGQLWTAVSTQLNQTYSSTNVPELHMGAAYWAVGTRSFDKTGRFTLTSQGYVSAMHEEMEFPAMAAGAGNGRVIMDFTLSGNGGEFGADNGGFYPSTAFGRLTATSGGLLQSTVNIADLGQAPQDGFTEYLGYPGTTRPRWGDYSNAVYMGGRYYFATNYIQYPNCLPPQFTLTIGTCGGTRDGLANWGTSVNYVRP